MANQKNIAIGINKNDVIWYSNFSNAPYFMIFDSEGNIIGKKINPYGAGQKTFLENTSPQLIIDILKDCSVFVSTKIGEKVKKILKDKYGIEAIATDEKDPKKFLIDYLGKDQIKDN